jgi:hypothetical protein
MRVNSGVNPATPFTTDDPSTPAQDAAPSTVAQELDAPSQSTGNDKRFEGQLDAFLVRSHLDSGRDEVASGTKATLPTAGGTPTLPLAGMRIGVNKYGEDVHVTKEVGSPQGFDSRLQAIAAARMTGTDPAAVVQTNDSKWHAVETNKNFAGGLDAAADTPTRAVEGLPSAAHIDELRDKVRGLRTELKQVNAEITQARQNEEVAYAIHENHQDQLAEQLLQAEEELASAVLGLPKEEIQINRSQTQDSSSKVNLDPSNQMPGAGAEYFDTGDLSGRPTIAISLDRLDKPKEAAGTLFHEISHVQDAKLAQKWLGQFRQEKTGFPNTADGIKDFQDWAKTPKGGGDLRKWLGQQPASSLSKSDAEVVEDAAAHANVSTEARAYTHASITALHAGDFDALKDQFKSYASAIKKGQTANPLDQSETMKTLTQELRTAYQQVPKESQAQFRDAVAAAKEVNPNAWISKLDFTK